MRTQPIPVDVESRKSVRGNLEPEHWSFCSLFFESVETVLLSLSPLPLNVLLWQFSERTANVRHVGHGFPQILNESKKCHQFSQALWSAHVLNCSDLPRSALRQSPDNTCQRSWSSLVETCTSLCWISDQTSPIPWLSSVFGHVPSGLVPKPLSRPWRLYIRQCPRPFGITRWNISLAETMGQMGREGSCNAKTAC